MLSMVTFAKCILMYEHRVLAWRQEWKGGYPALITPRVLFDTGCRVEDCGRCIWQIRVRPVQDCDGGMGRIGTGGERVTADKTY